MSLQLLWLEYREAHPDGYGYSQFANLYRAWRGQVDVTMRQAHQAGEKLFVDFPGDTVPVWDRRTGEVALRAELFVAIMGASSYLYAEAFASQELLYWVTAHVHCFEALAGCPGDRGVRQPALGGDQAAPVRAGRERHLRRDGRALRRRRDPREGVQAAGQGQGRVGGADRRADGHRPAPGPQVLFAGRGERRDQRVHCGDQRPAVPEARRQPGQLVRAAGPAALRPLPASRYEFATWHKARVNIDFRLAADKHYYSVPYQLARQQVDVRLSAATVEVFHGSRRVASHVRSHVRHGHTTDPAPCQTPTGGTPSGPRSGSPTGPADRPATAALVEAILASRPHPEQGYRAALGIVRLAGRYGGDRAEAACARALALRAWSYRSVESILRAGLDRQPLPGSAPELPRTPRTPTCAAPATTTRKDNRSCSTTPPSTG